jgi:ferredoxin-NADP reductase
VTEQVTELAGAGTAAPTGAWRTATVRSVSHPSDHAVVLRLDVPNRIDHWPGQHYVIRLTAEDGYTAQRSYSLASAPSDPQLEFYVEALPDGEVSGFLNDGVEVGDELEIRGPIGGWFVWTADGPMLGVVGGSGVVPIVSMLRHATHLGRTDRMSLAVSARTLADLPYADELIAAGALVTLTREARGGRPAARVQPGELAPLVPAAGPCFVCGSPSFSGSIGSLLMDLAVDTARIRVESFGPSG